MQKTTKTNQKKHVYRYWETGRHVNLRGHSQQHACDVTGTKILLANGNVMLAKPKGKYNGKKKTHYIISSNDTD